MRLDISLETLRAFLENDPDSEALSPDEYICDLYETPAPITINLKLNKDGVEILAAAYLDYDEANKGYVMGARIDDADTISTALGSAIEAARG